MRFQELRLPGVYAIDLEPIEDERGWFARTWCADELAALGLDDAVKQCSLSFSRRKGTLRGLHFQADPFAEAKVVRCTRGSIHDIVVDLRPDSPTCFQWAAIDLRAGDGRSLYIPKGLAHGFQALEDATEVFYQISQFYDAGSRRGIRWNDPFFRIEWPLPDPLLSERDRSYPDFDPALLPRPAGS
jgi:dTDP-4-dehydrorhamnose 3,5-epimerase